MPLFFISDEFLASIKKQAERKTWPDDADGDFNPMEYSGGNFDDAYYGGCDDGETDAARAMLKELEGNERGQP